MTGEHVPIDLKEGKMAGEAKREPRTISAAKARKAIAYELRKKRKDRVQSTSAIKELKACTKKSSVTRAKIKEALVVKTTRGTVTDWDEDNMTVEDMYKRFVELDTQLDKGMHTSVPRIKEAIQQYFSFGYSKYNKRADKLSKIKGETPPGYVYVDVSRMLRLQESISCADIEWSNPFEVLWKYIEAHTDYLNPKKVLNYYSYSRSTRSRDSELFNAGKLFTSRHLNKALAILSRVCGYKTSTLILSEVLKSSSLTLHSCVVWDIARALALERKNEAPEVISSKYPVLHVKDLGSTDNSTCKVLVLVSTDALHFWLQEYLKTLSIIRAAVHLYLRKEKEHSAYRFDLDPSVGYYEKVLRTRVSRSLQEAKEKVESSTNIVII